ncbi:MAG TPA: hypothetical protein VGD91_17280 [Trebonia sp.]
MSLFSGTRTWLTAAGAAAGLLALAVPAAASGAQPAAGPAWRVVKTVKTDDSGQFTALAVTGKTTAWAFDGLGFTSRATAWRENGSTWTKTTFPSLSGEEVVAAGAAAPKNVWAFTRNLSGASRVLRWNGSAWSAVKTFPHAIAGATVVSGHDVWVYGQAAVPGEPALGTWFYNGTKWTRVSPSFQGGSALSDKNVWAFSGTSLEHWTGARWVATPVKSLLPARNPRGLNDPAVTGVLALSAGNVYAFGNGDAEDEGGPLVVLHYNGSAWSKVASGQFGSGPEPQVSSDGKGGLWLPMDGGAGGTSCLVHYANGKLARAALPVSAPAITVGAVARVPGTAQQLAGGFTHAAGNRGLKVAAVLLRYS